MWTDLLQPHLFCKYFFENINHPFYYYIPDREKDGYGATKNYSKN